MKHLEKNMKVNPEVLQAELTGQIKLVQAHVSTIEELFKEKFVEINRKLDNMMGTNDTYLEKSEYTATIEKIMPAIKWVRDRQAVERFFIGGVAIIGLSNIILLFKIFVGGF